MYRGPVLRKRFPSDTLTMSTHTHTPQTELCSLNQTHYMSEGLSFVLDGLKTPDWKDVPDSKPRAADALNQLVV